MIDGSAPERRSYGCYETNAGTDWAGETDVIVIGAGGAGVVAALQATELGANVLAIDRFEGGGATSYSGGVIYAGATRHQEAAGFEDTPEEMFNYLAAQGVPVAADTLRRFCEGSRNDIEWLESHGVPFGSNPYLHKTHFPPDPHWLYFSGNEVVERFRRVARPAPRGHRVRTSGLGGRLFYQRLQSAARNAGVGLLFHTVAERLLVDDKGVVIGVEASRVPESRWATYRRLYEVVQPFRPFNGERAQRAVRALRELDRQLDSPRRYRARKGVIIATGGFIYNLELLARFNPVIAQSYRSQMRLGSLGDLGDGIRLAQDVGAEVGYMNEVSVGRRIVPPTAFGCGLLVNREGGRFVNEVAYSVEVGGAIARQAGPGDAWLLLHWADFRRAVGQSFRPGKGLFKAYGAPALANMAFGGTRFAWSLPSLARRIGISSAGLDRTIADLNAAIRRGEPDVHGKDDAYRRKFEGGPYVAVNMALSNSLTPATTFTTGGLAIDETTGEVVNRSGTAVRGLYAAGRAAVGICSTSYVSGLSIADAIFSGRRAARHAVTRRVGD